MFADALNRTVVRLFLAVRREEGQTFVEYSLIGFVVAVAVAALLLGLNTKIGDALTAIEGKL